MASRDQLLIIRAARAGQAPAQGNADAESLLEKVAPCRDAGWTDAVQRKWAERGAKAPLLLAARIELAAAFGLSRPEALLLDIHAADHGHCLAVDVQADHARSKPRLVLVRTDVQRQMLNRIAQMFEDIDCSQDGAEGNYRQRLYRLNCTLA